MHRLFYMMKRSRKLISANKGETIMSNTVITIARQYGSGGRTVGKMLAKRLNIPCYDREDYFARFRRKRHSSHSVPG